MNTLTRENSKPHLQRSSWRGSSEQLFCFCSRSWLILFALVALASTARANWIGGISDCNCTNLTINVGDFPQGPLVAVFGGVTLDVTYDYANQKIVASRPAGLSPGTYLLAISRNEELLASANVSLCNCDLCAVTATPGITITESCPSGPVSAGSSVMFGGLVSNSGNITLTNVLVFSSQPSNSLVLGPIVLAPGITAPFTGSYIATGGSNPFTNSMISSVFTTNIVEGFTTSIVEGFTTNVVSDVTTNITTTNIVMIITNAVPPELVTIRPPLAPPTGEVVGRFEVGTNLNGLTYYGGDLGIAGYYPTLFYSIRHTNLGESILTIIKTEVAPHTLPPRTEPKDAVGVRNYDALAFAAPQITGASSLSLYYLRHDAGGASYFGYIIPGGVHPDMFSGGSIGNNFSALTFAAPNAAAQGANLFYYLRQDITGNSFFGTINPDAATAATAATDLFNLGKRIDYMTFSTVDVGYGPANQFYYLRYDSNGDTVFGTIDASAGFVGPPANRAVDRFTLTGHFQELEFTDTDVGYNANLFYSIRGGDTLRTNTEITSLTNTVTTFTTNIVAGFTTNIVAAFTTNIVTAFTTNSVVNFTPTNTVTATGMDICQARIVSAAADCLGPVAPVPQPAPTVEPLGPIIGAPTMANGIFSLSFPTQNGKSYTVQYKNTLNDPTWTDLETVVGTGGNLSITDAAAAQRPTRFYRLKLTP